jgi:hypothetical protein
MPARILFTSFWLCFFSAWGMAQSAEPSDSGRVALLFKVPPADFSSIKLDGQPFGSLAVSGKYPSVWPLPPGKHTLAFEAQGALPKQLEFNVSQGQTILLILDLKPLKPPLPPGAPSKAVSVRAASLDLPKPGSTPKIFAYLEPGLPDLNAIVSKGSGRDIKTSKANLPSSRLIPLGEGEMSVAVDGQTIFSANPSSPGNFVKIVVRDSEGRLKSHPLSFFTKKGS